MEKSVKHSKTNGKEYIYTKSKHLLHSLLHKQTKETLVKLAMYYALNCVNKLEVLEKLQVTI